MVEIKEDLRKPSEVYDEYWIYTYNSKNSYLVEMGKNTGKWLIFASVSEIDQVWEKVRVAIKEGMLGDSAKVATMKENPNALKSNYKVICVYTNDFTNEEDVMRIAKNLIDLEVPEKLRYKSDMATIQGKYANKGGSSILYEVTKETFYPKDKQLNRFFS